MLLSMRRIQVHLEEELDEALARQALDRGIAKAALIREYLAMHVAREYRTRERPGQRLIAAYEGSSRESSSVDDVLYDR
jgi:Ribbon-helix-helix protein, copG family